MWELNNDKPIYLQIIEIMKVKMIKGEYRAGDKLESVRDLALIASVNPNTMQKALTYLEQEGLIITNRTSGRNITEDNNMIIKLKEDMANNLIINFLEEMKQIGITRDETIKLINSAKENVQ